jgi:hypothetical protein
VVLFGNVRNKISMSDNMDEKLQKLVELRNETEKDIEKEIELLPRHGDACDCGDPEVFKQIFSGHFDEITETCLKCGGYIEK